MAKNSKVGHFRGNNSYKGSPYNFIKMKTFDKLDLLIISASKSFSGSKEEFFLHLRDQNIYFQPTPGQNINSKILQAPSKSNGLPVSQNVIWLYSLSVQRGRIEYEGESSV
jgi:hypothetical protein